MAWIESHQSLSRHRKTLRAVALLKVDRHKLLGHLHELWWWGLDNADVEGHLGHTPHEMIAEAAGWPLAKADAFVEALVDAGFIESTSDGLTLHDWADYAGKLIDRRDRNKARMRRSRGGEPEPEPPHSNGTRAAHEDTDERARAEHVQPSCAARATNRARTCSATGPDPTGPISPLTPQGAARTAVPKPKPERVPITDGEIEELVGKYAERYGGRQPVRDEIELALNHTARFKALRERLYVDGWLRKELQHRPGGLRLVTAQAARAVIDRTGVAN